MEFPRDEIVALIAALKARYWLAAVVPAFSVGRWLVAALRQAGAFDAALKPGVLSSTEPLDIEGAVVRFEGMVGETPAALDQATMALLLRFLIDNVLPQILNRLGR